MSSFRASRLCGAICKNRFEEKTESPNQPVFKRFADIWTNIDQFTYNLFEFTSRKQQRIEDNFLQFFWNWIENKNIARGDYLKQVELTILFLGGANLSNKIFSFKSPSAFFHARWMAKIMYTLKIALFQTQ